VGSDLVVAGNVRLERPLPTTAPASARCAGRQDDQSSQEIWYFRPSELANRSVPGLPGSVIDVAHAVVAGLALRRAARVGDPHVPTPVPAATSSDPADYGRFTTPRKRVLHAFPPHTHRPLPESLQLHPLEAVRPAKMSVMGPRLGTRWVRVSAPLAWASRTPKSDTSPSAPGRVRILPNHGQRRQPAGHGNRWSPS
jgi:hypothetical protein